MRSRNYIYIMMTVAGLFFAACSGQGNKTTGDAGQDNIETAEADTMQIYDISDEMPQFSGGDEGLMKWLQDNIQYPEEALNNKTEGRVIVRFVIDRQGNVNDAEIIESTDKQFDEEALRVVNSMPAWTPGKQEGKAVNVWFTLPVTFKLD